MAGSRVKLRQVLRLFSSRDVAFHSVVLIATYLVAAGTGIAFWAVAGRVMTPETLGNETALLALINAAGIVAAAGTANSFTALLPVEGCDRPKRLLDGYLIVGLFALLLGGAAGILATRTLHMNVVAATSWTVIGAFAVAFYTVKDSAMVALGGTVNLLFQNFGASVGKLAALPLVVGLIPHPAVTVTVAAFAIVAALAIFVAVPRLTREGTHSAGAETAAPTRRDIALFSVRDGVGSAMVTGIFLILPFLTTWLAGPTQGAVLMLALSFALALEMISAGVANALTTGLSSSSAFPWPRGHRAWVVTQIAAVLVAAGLALAGPLVERLLGPQYQGLPITQVLAIIAFGFAARVAFVIWASVMRSLNQTRAIMVANAIATVVAIPWICWCIVRWGAVGAAAGLGIACAAMGLFGAIRLINGARRGDQVADLHPRVSVVG